MAPNETASEYRNQNVLYTLESESYEAGTKVYEVTAFSSINVLTE